MNLTSILTLLQLVLALLSNPTTANNPQIQTLAQSAVSDAAQAIAQQQTPTQVSNSATAVATTTSSPTSTPTVYNPQVPIGNHEIVGATSTPITAPYLTYGGLDYADTTSDMTIINELNQDNIICVMHYQTSNGQLEQNTVVTNYYGVNGLEPNGQLEDCLQQEDELQGELIPFVNNL